MIRVVMGIDLSLRSTGTAVMTAETAGSLVTRTITTEGRRGDSWLTRLDRLRRIRAESLASLVDQGPLDHVLVVIEGPSYGSGGAGVWDRAAAWWMVFRSLHYGGAHLAVAPPAVRARWATGHGRADKAAVASHLGQLASTTFETSDAADAAALAWMGAMRLGWVSGPRLDVLRGVAWPDLADDTYDPDGTDDGH